MAAYIQFRLKGTNDPLPLNQVDEFICNKLGRDVHPTKWVDNWFNIEALSLATGGTIEQLIEDFPERKIAPILKEYLEWDNWFGR